ncbi:major facilitator superfamily domain-containing protein [Aspergillus lucknowensis]|uniref:Major facilitator superfamily domain-containing protein n=1 Tax=Aspergillus lucknowensis TaxID=176173 RepID=A0ABR4LTX0_9EURO
MHESTPLLQNQSHSLPRKRLLLVVPAIALIQFTSFLDQTSISTSLPALASALDTGASISLVGACFLITSTSIQLINGRLSDIFGRKTSLVTALLIMGLGNFVSGFSSTPLQLFAARAFTGFGAGAINALVQIAIADITTLEQRGYYFGIVGVATALGNGLGPVIGGALTQRAGWQWAFWFVCPLCVMAICYLVALKLVDWPGALASLLGITLLLIPISQGGATMPWTSPLTICMLVAGVTLFGVFLTIEWRIAKLPLLPAHLFRYGRSTSILIGASPSHAGVLLLPLVIAHGVTSALTGILISASGHYKPIIVTGAVCWSLAAVAKLYYDQETAIWRIVVVGILDGVGVGCSLQPVLVGLLAGSDSSDRAVLTGLRNFLRDMGGATSTTASGTILSNVLYARLGSRFSQETIAKLVSSAFALDDFDLTKEEKALVSRGYMNGLHAVFVSFAVLIMIHLCACMCIQDYGLKRDRFQPKQQQQACTP